MDLQLEALSDLKTIGSDQTWNEIDCRQRKNIKRIWSRGYDEPQTSTLQVD